MAPLEFTRGISARMNAEGKETSPVVEGEIRAAIKELHSYGIEALTVSLLNSYANPLHERRIKEIAQNIIPTCRSPSRRKYFPNFANTSARSRR